MMQHPPVSGSNPAIFLVLFETMY